MATFLRLFPKASLGSYLIAMTIAITLPILVFVALLLIRLESNEQDALERRTARDTQAVATAVGRQLQDMTTTLRLLSLAPELEEGDLEAFHRRTQSALSGGTLFVIVVRKDGQQIVNTRLHYGVPLGKTSDMASLQKALDEGGIIASDVFFGETSDRWVFNVIKPLAADLPSGAAAVIMTQNADELAKYVTSSGLAPGWSTALVDADGNVVASSDSQRNPPGKPLPSEILARMDGFSGTVNQDDEAGTILGYATLPGWSWRAVVWGPAATAQVSVLTTWKLLLIGGMSLLAIAIAAAYLVGGLLRKPIEEIAEMAERLGAGEIVSPIDTKIVEANQVAIALSNASFDRSQAEDHIHLILRELAHRTKNMLTLIQAMMRQTAKQSQTMAEFQASMAERLEGLGRSIDLLTAVEWAGVSMRRLVESQLSNLLDTADQIEIRGADFNLKPEAVQNLGLVLHELATNAVKYGALSTPRGKVVISWSRMKGEDDQPRIRVGWTESGGPAVAEPERKGFGRTIIERHAEAAFSGKVEMSFAPEGLRWEINAPLEAMSLERRAS
jgi:two-component sensor histidine kinase